MDEIKLTRKEKAAIRALEKLAENWPDTLWIFATGENMVVLKVGNDGKRVYNGLGCVDDGRSVASIFIPNDGGDF